jgi:hypothetical protein
MSGEKDYLLGTDRIDFLCGNNSFYAEYAYHQYYGTYYWRDGKCFFNADFDFLSPFRESFFSELNWQETANGKFLLDQDSNVVFKINHISGK